MSVALLIAALAGRRKAIHVGFTSGGESSTSGAFHGSAAVGDYAVITYFNGVTISPAAGGSAYTTASFTSTKVSHRIIQQADLDGSFTFSGATPYIASVWRGPRSLSAERTTLSALSTLSGGLYRFAIPGFTRRYNAVGIIGVAAIADPSGFLTDKADGTLPGTFDAVRNQSTSGVCYGVGVVTDLANYADDTTFLGYTSPDAESVNARTYELLA